MMSMEDTPASPDDAPTTPALKPRHIPGETVVQIPQTLLVLDHTGAPVPDLPVSVTLGWEPIDRLLTNRDGAATFTLPEDARMSVDFHLPADGPGLQEVQMVPNERAWTVILSDPAWTH